MAEKNKKFLVDLVDSALPQTQCQECEFSACRPYAEAVVDGLAPIDRCKPGGEVTLNRLADLMSIDPSPYLQTVIDQFRPASVVRIDLDTCIGCAKCIKVCPVDAIIGSAKQAHVVLDDVCTGCNLCIAPCPVDCIYEVPVAHKATLDRQIAQQSRARFRQRNARLDKKIAEKKQAYLRAQKFAMEELS